MRRRKSDWKWTGFAMVAAGIAIMAWCNIQDPDLVGMGRVLVIVGAVVAVFAKLKDRTGATHEAFLIGRDAGREEGFQEGFREGRKAKPERPVLVDLDAHRDQAPADSSARQAGRRSDDE